jgi:signal transduction histidine kinase
MNHDPDRVRILLVEDNPADVRLLRESLRDSRREDFDLIHAGRLDAGLSMLAQDSIDVVLLDLSLPDAQGLETVSRTLSAAPHIPIVVLTGLDDEEVAVRSLREGAQDYLVKGHGDGHLLVRALRYAIERKRAELEHQRLETQLQNAQRLESLGILAGGIAHDFNNLLTIITCNAQYLRQTTTAGPAQVTAIQDIETAAAHATEMTRSLLAFSRPSKPQVRPIDANDLIGEVYRFLRRVLPATIEFRFQADPAPCTIAVDPGQMQQVLINLCLNARDALPAGGIMELETSRTSREDLPPGVQAQATQDDYVRIRVRDNGVGMDADTLRQIFDPFFTTKSKDRGTGLGLAIVYRLVEVHKGIIDVDSRPGQGTRFDVYFPAAVPEDPPMSEPKTARADGRERILILDDEEMIASLMRTLLESRGYSVAVTTRPEEAIRIAADPQEKLDLAIVDYHLPGMRGDACLAELRRGRPELDALIVTGDATGLGELEDPHTRLLSKPFSAEKLGEVVRQVLDSRQAVHAHPR